MLVENVVAPPQNFAPGGVIVPSSSAGDFDTTGGATTSGGPKDKETSGANIRTGGPGQTSLIRIGTGLLAKGHSISTLSMSFRYVAGYTPAPSQNKKPAVVKVVLLDMASSAVLKTVFTSTPLGNYSYDHFTQYSPPIEVRQPKTRIVADLTLSWSRSWWFLKSSERRVHAVAFHPDRLRRVVLGCPTISQLLWPSRWTTTNAICKYRLMISRKVRRIRSALWLACSRNQRKELGGYDEAGMNVTGFTLHVGWSSAFRQSFQPESPFVPGFGATPPAPFGSGQLWAKKLDKGSSAVLFINHSPKPQSYNGARARQNLL